MLETDKIIGDILNKNTPNVLDFVNSLFEVQLMAKIHHLQAKTKSYAQHMALGTLYAELEDITDTFVESYQGKYNIIKGYTNITISENVDFVTYLTSKLKVAEKTRTTLQDGYLQQLIDDIIELYAQTLYKLKYLQ